MEDNIEILIIIVHNALHMTCFTHMINQHFIFLSKQSENNLFAQEPRQRICLWANDCVDDIPSDIWQFLSKQLYLNKYDG